MVRFSPSARIDQLARLRYLDRVDADGRLIENQHLRIVNDRLRQPDALSEALGQWVFRVSSG